MQLSNHARERIQQRGILYTDIAEIEEFGDIEYRPGGAFELKIKKSTKNYLISKLKNQINLIERASKKAIIISADDFSAITVFHQRKYHF